MNPLLLTDYYKTEHHKQYPEGTTLVYSNLTPRKSRLPGVDHMVFFGLQYFIKEYLIKRFNRDFFGIFEDKIQGEYNIRLASSSTQKQWKQGKIDEYKRHINVDTKHIEALWDLGYLPIEIKSLEEGTKVPMRVPCLTIKNTHPDFFWLTNYLETLLSTTLWQACTSATIAYEYKKLFTYYLQKSGCDETFVQWMGHDFSLRGMSSIESGILSGMGHLLSFTGTDTIPAIYALEDYYNAKGLIGGSCVATEHSVMAAGTCEDELGTFKRLLDLYPTGILSVVSDTWDLWKVLTEYLPKLKEQIMSRDGKLVIRPDSGDPVDIICGFNYYKEFVGSIDKHYVDFEHEDIINSLDTNKFYQVFYGPEHDSYIEVTSQGKGVIELLWDVFGGTINEQGYKVLDPHIGAIYGDSITLDRAKQISERLMAKGFAPLLVYGIGSYTYQYNTRDTFGLAMKATYCEVISSKQDWQNEKSIPDYIKDDKKYGRWVEGREIYKSPVTDNGEKKSAKGLLWVGYKENTKDITLVDQCDWEEEGQGLLTTVFKDGKLVRETTLEEIRNRLNN